MPPDTDPAPTTDEARLLQAASQLHDAQAELAQSATTPPAPAADPTVDEPLGDAGKRALDAERAARKEADKRLKAMEAELDKLREAQMSEQERAVAEARREGAAEASAAVQARLFAAEAKVAAAGRVADPTLLADPDVARKLLGLDTIPVTPDGDIDSEAISGAIDRLLQERPFLAATSGATPPPKPTGSADGGARGATAPSQIGRDDLKSMTPDQIAQAKADGRLNDLLGIS